jgi:uncharacterized protein YbjQ (UPF0145 family)
MVTETTLTMDAYVASDTYGPVLIKKTIVAGANLVKGTILGRITASGKLTAAASTNTDDGSRTAVAVLMEDAAAASADVAAIVGFAGVYVEANMTGLTAAYKLALEANGIYFV